MTTIKIIDINNTLRVKFEKDPWALRSFFEDAFRSSEIYMFVFDGKNAKKSRRAIFPGYKEGRNPAPDNFYIQLDMFRELLMYTNKVHIRVEGYEADDVIAALVRSRPDVNWLIDSNDGDFMRLTGPTVSITTATLKDIAPEDIRLYKALKGDNSDKVKGIYLFGDKAWGKLDQPMKDKWAVLLDSLVSFFKMPLTDEEVHQKGQELELDGLGLSASQELWVRKEWRLLVSYWLVVDFLPMEMSLISANMKVGKPNYELGNNLLRELNI